MSLSHDEDCQCAECQEAMRREQRQYDKWVESGGLDRFRLRERGLPLITTAGFFEGILRKGKAS